MLKVTKNSKNYLNSNELIIKAMYKRRRLSLVAISKICEKTQLLRVVK